MLKPAPVRTGPKPMRDKKRAMSWSQISSFEYDKEQWYRKYVLKIRPETSAAMEFGSKIGKQIETDPDYLPEIPRQKVMEYEFKAKYKGITLTGFADAFDDEKFLLEEYKTGKWQKPWTQKRVDSHGQITMYLFMKWLCEKIPPERFTCRLHWLPTDHNEEDGTVRFLKPIEKHIKHFRTKRTMKDLREFAQRLETVVASMDRYCEVHP